MKSSEKGERPLRPPESSLEIEKLKKCLSLMEKAHSLLSEFMPTIKKEQLEEREGDKITNLLEDMESSVSQIGRTSPTYSQ